MELLKGFKSLQNDNIKLVLAGNEPFALEREYRATAPGDKRMVFFGRRALGDLFPRLDVDVVPPLLEEPLGGAAFEALAFGRQVPGVAASHRRCGLISTVCCSS